MCLSLCVATLASDACGKQLAPHKFQLFVPCQVFFNRVVNTLDGHVREVGPVEHVGKGGTESERVDAPMVAGSVTWAEFVRAHLRNWFHGRAQGGGVCGIRTPPPEGGPHSKLIF